MHGDDCGGLIGIGPSSCALFIFFPSFYLSVSRDRYGKLLEVKFLTGCCLVIPKSVENYFSAKKKILKLNTLFSCFIF